MKLEKYLCEEMSFEDVFKTLEKLLFDQYVEVSSSYQMYELILDRFDDDDYLLCLLTGRELDFLKYIDKHEVSEDDEKKYRWEIDALSKKFIYHKESKSVFEEVQPRIKKVLKSKHLKDYNFYEIITVIVGFIRSTGVIDEDNFENYIDKNFPYVDVDNVLGSPLFNFYCCNVSVNNPKEKRKMDCIVYDDYFPQASELLAKKENEGHVTFTHDYLQDMFYYGLPLSKPLVKKMYDEIIEKHARRAEYLFEVVDNARLFNDTSSFEEEIPSDKLRNIVLEAFEYLPCPLYHGASPKQWQDKDRIKDANFKFEKIPQNNAKLCKKAADAFYRSFMALFDFANKKYNLVPEVEDIKCQQDLMASQARKIGEYVFNHIEIIDNFVKSGDYGLTQKELDTVLTWKNGITSDNLVVVGIEREYAEVLDYDNKRLYMVKGLRSDFYEMFGNYELPFVMGTTLLEFDNKIVTSGLIKTGQDKLDYQEIEEVYHLKDTLEKLYRLHE